jgi:predicted dehydrogenase
MNTEKPIRWGILATGRIASEFVEDLLQLPEATVAAVGSRRLDSATAFAERYGIPRAHGDWADLASDPEVDVVYVATPHSAHHAAAKMCLEAGKAVLCEKPLTIDLATAQDLVDTARARGVFLMEAMWTLTNPTIRHIDAVLDRGEIGEITHIAADFGVNGPFPVGHRMRAPELGGGALLDLGVYPVALAHHFLGRPATITARANLLPEGTDETTALILGYASGAVATLHAGMGGESAQRAVLTGRDGRIEIDRHFWRPEGATIVRRHGLTERVDIPVDGHGMGNEAREVMRCLRAGLTESSLIPLDFTLGVMTTLDTALQQLGVVYPPTESSGAGGAA